jgi:hypothetical protein
MRARLTPLRYVLQHDLGGEIETVLRALHPLDPLEIERSLIYLEQGSRKVSGAQIVAAVRRVSERKEGKSMAGVVELLEKRGRDLGRAEGKAETLLRLLQRRFGDVPQAARDRIANADVASLDRWLDRVIDAADLASVLKDRTRA